MANEITVEVSSHLRSILGSIAALALEAKNNTTLDVFKVSEYIRDIEGEVKSATNEIGRMVSVAVKAAHVDRYPAGCPRGCEDCTARLAAYRAEERGMARFGGQHDEHGAPAGPGEQFATSLDAIAAQIMEMEPLDARD